MTLLRQILHTLMVFIFSIFWIGFCTCLGAVSELVDASEECWNEFKTIWNP